ncbi:TPA: hypothetical protein JBF32_14315 [Legionella pneumophila]|uniref:hypothetical protein n=1 Tax=Legionella pneumophila TaxID=446 RepID=UPI001A2CD30B|nr:hypothetical protein [Legionella pneumophila]MDW8914950.1 hypothetical protein [Legionella pneumophila]MDW9078392.1 hypothetical protein [Legionella pneumophila]MDW9084374.1 hypothetical protein [Legionella pneumophila]MDW9108615.1 hypothetical protein [Legionella pneumophila]
MSDDALFSQFYFPETTRHEDKVKFRNRLLLYIEDFVNSGWPKDTYDLCRYQLGISIKRDASGNHLWIEQTFNKQEIDISQILDFISVVYDSLLPHINGSYSSQPKLNELIEKINRIFQEESMCYILTDNGRVRFYPDEEFHQLVKCTLSVLNKPKYKPNLDSFNDVLDELYKNHGKESPIVEFFKCLETFVLTIVKDKKYNRLNDNSIDKLLGIIENNSQILNIYSSNDCEALQNFPAIFKKWITMGHKYRHGKADQINNNVPTELSNLILSQGISIFRFLLELDDKYNLS